MTAQHFSSLATTSSSSPYQPTALNYCRGYKERTNTIKSGSAIYTLRCFIFYVSFVVFNYLSCSLVFCFSVFCQTRVVIHISQVLFYFSTCFFFALFLFKFYCISTRDARRNCHTTRTCSMMRTFVYRQLILVVAASQRRTS